MNKNVIF